MIVALIGTGVGISNSRTSRENSRKEAIALRDQMAKSAEAVDLLNQGKIPEDALLPSASPMASADGVTGPATTELELLRAARRIFGAANAEQLRAATLLQQEENSIGLERLLLPENLTSEAGIAAGRRTLAKSKDIQQRRMAATDRYDANMDTNLGAEIPRSRFPGFWSSYETNKSKRQQITRSWFANQDAMVARLEAILDLMESQIGHTQSDNGQLMFDDGVALEKYNALLGEFQQLGVHDENIKSQMAALQNEAVSKMNAALQ